MKAAGALIGMPRELRNTTALYLGSGDVPENCAANASAVARVPALVTGHAQHIELADEIAEDDCAVAGH
jgi:hypothetical protein